MSENQEPVTPDFSRVDPTAYTLRIGVTGHRALRDESAVRDAVKRLVLGIDETLRRSAAEPRSTATSERDYWFWLDWFLLKLVKFFWWTMPKTPKRVPPERQVPLKWRVVSALAKGADQIVADVVLKEVHGTLQPALPFKPEVFERDFETPEERASFHQFLNDSKNPWVANDSDNPSTEDRVAGYRLAGERVVDESDIVIAVWDGESARGVGGTAEIVSYALRQHVPVYWIRADDPAREPVLLVAGEDGSQEERELPHTAKTIVLRYHQISAYFRDPAYRESSYKAIYAREQGYLAKKLKESGLDSAAMREAIQHRLAQHAYADHLALRHQSLHLRATKAIIIFAALAVTAAAIQLLAYEDHKWIIGFEIAFMFCVLTMLRVSLREGWHEKWLYDRYLAERLRGLIFREGLGHPPTEPNSIRELLPFYEGPSAWVDLILVSDSPENVPAGKQDGPEQLRQFLNVAWIGSQGGWHGRNAEKKKQAKGRFRIASVALFFVIIICAVLHWNDIGHDNSNSHGPGIPEVLGILAVTLPAWGGALHGIAHLMDYGRIAQRSESMHRELGKLSHELEHAESVEAIGDVAERADKLMAMENLEWMMTLAHREPELHV